MPEGWARVVQTAQPRRFPRERRASAAPPHGGGGGTAAPHPHTPCLPAPALTNNSVARTHSSSVLPLPRHEAPNKEQRPARRAAAAVTGHAKHGAGDFRDRGRVRIHAHGVCVRHRRASAAAAAEPRTEHNASWGRGVWLRRQSGGRLRVWRQRVGRGRRGGRRERRGPRGARAPAQVQRVPTTWPPQELPRVSQPR